MTQETFFKKAAIKGDTAILENEMNADTINIQSEKGHKTALMYAAANGRKDAVELLLRVENINVNLCDTEGYNALMLAVMLGETEIVKMLIDQTDLTHVNNQGDDVFRMSENPEINDILKNHLP